MTTDNTNPTHYTRLDPEPITITENMSFCLGNVVKYILRAGSKQGSPAEEDLAKALWYALREHDRLTREGASFFEAVINRIYDPVKKACQQYPHKDIQDRCSQVLNDFLVQVRYEKVDQLMSLLYEEGNDELDSARN